jgi:hypothetical protein
MKAQRHAYATLDISITFYSPSDSTTSILTHNNSATPITIITMDAAATAINKLL